MSSSLLACSHRRFNGAAIRRRRRDGEAARLAHVLVKASTEPPSEDGGEGESQRSIAKRFGVLQRSRHPKTAESIAGGESGSHLSRASTEPPSEDGGEADTAERPSKVTFALQRSRHPKTAERA